MPQLGEIKKGIEIGYTGKVYFMWSGCVDCGKERWIHLVKGQPESLRCYPCSRKSSDFPRGESHKNWKGGRFLDHRGYMQRTLTLNEEFFLKTAGKRRCLPEHRLVMAKHLGRNLHPWEIVHHKNGIKDDNRIENLELTSGISQHIKQHSQGYRDGFRKGLKDAERPDGPDYNHDAGHNLEVYTLRRDRPDRKEIAKTMWLAGDKATPKLDKLWDELAVTKKLKWLRKAEPILALFPDMDEVAGW